MHWFVLIVSFLGLAYTGTCFNFTTASVADVHKAIETGSMSCRKIIQGYLDRIDAYNHAGPNIRAITTVNDKALMQAIELDIYYNKTGKLSGILHCIPLAVKDNIDVADLPTTSGWNVFKYMIPKTDADTVRNAKQAGAIVIGKTNMSPGADKEAWGHSETGGLIRNPYDTNHTTYGSSGGNAAAGAAAFTILGFGSETGVSINQPSSAANLVGLRPPVSLVSQNGVFPNSVPQDVVGPMAKRVEDVALLLDAMTGNYQREFSTPQVLKENGLDGARINIFKLFAYDTFPVPDLGSYEVDPEITILFDTMVKNMISAGANVKNISVDIPTTMGTVLKMQGAEYGSCLRSWRSEYLGNIERYGIDAPYHNVEEVVHTKILPPPYQGRWEEFLKLSPDNCAKDMANYMSIRKEFIEKVITPILKDADVAFWPTLPVFPMKLGEAAFKHHWEVKGGDSIHFILSGSWSAYPTMTIPLGFSKPTTYDTTGLPAGAMFIAKPEHLKSMLKIAYSYQKKFGISKNPVNTPELPSK